MKTLIVGAGAVGAYVGGYLARDGVDVTLVDAWPAHVDAMRSDGLRLEGQSEDECFTTPVRALHLTDMVLGSDPAHAGALEVRAGALETLLERSAGENFSEVQWLRGRIAETRDRLASPGDG